MKRKKGRVKGERSQKMKEKGKWKEMNKSKEEWGSK